MSCRKKQPLAIAPSNIDADGWNQIVGALERPLSNEPDEAALVRNAYKRSFAGRPICDPQIVGSIILPNIRPADGSGCLELSVECMAQSPADDSPWQAVLTAGILKRKEVTE